jgi:DUF2934 family protein
MPSLQKRRIVVSIPEQGGTHMRTHAQSSIQSVKTKSNSRPGAAQGESLTEEQQRSLVALAAYYLAERRRFEPGHELEDWLAAELQIGSKGMSVS